MIIAGYPGIGKSTICGCGLYRAIDLDSSLFKEDDFPKRYCKVAQKLAEQDYIVFVSTHAEVLDYLRDHSISYYVIVPSTELKSVWIQKLKDRLKNDNCDENIRALDFVSNNYDRSIVKIMCENKKRVVVICRENYELAEMIGVISKHFYEGSTVGGKNSFYFGSHYF